MKLHPLLVRQLRKTVGPELARAIEDREQTSLGAPIPEGWRALLERVSAAYAQADQDRYMLERSLERSSEEMSRLYDELHVRSEAAIAKKGEELTRSLALMTSVQEAVADAILVTDVDRRILSYNQRFLDLWRLRRDQMVGSELFMHLVAQAKDKEATVQLRASWRASSESGSFDIELSDERTFQVYTAPVPTRPGEAAVRVWCFRDVTDERRLAARRAVLTERMTSVGQLVASVAHEINNPLAYIAGNVDTVIEALSGESATDDEELLEALEDARIGVDRIKVIVRDLRALSRVDDESRESVDVRTIVEKSLQMANNELRHRARVVRDLKKTPSVNANPVRLGQVVLNLLVNAAHAIPDGRASDNSVTVTTCTTSTGYARIEIRDTGSGISPENLERIFDPFFTTKPVGAGTGLGLSICKGIIEKLGGTITVESAIGSGTRFVVELPPSSAKSASESGAAIKIEEKKTIDRSILVIDDDAQIRRWFQRILPSHQVTTVPSVEAAEDAIMSTSFDVILCDVMMPDRTGLDMYHFIEQKRPDLLDRMIFMSGGAFTPALAGFLETVPNTCMKKPFRKDELEEVISSTIAKVRSKPPLRMPMTTLPAGSLISSVPRPTK